MTIPKTDAAHRNTVEQMVGTPYCVRDKAGFEFPGSRDTTPRRCRRWFASAQEMPWAALKRMGFHVSRANTAL